jgi:hypothetical protein
MSAPRVTPRQLYQSWVEEQIEEHKARLTRDELMTIADEAVDQLFDAPDGQYPLTEMLLCDVVDQLLFHRLKLPDYRHWRRMRHSDTPVRPLRGTTSDEAAPSNNAQLTVEQKVS